jgi:hypothetical protein
MSFPSVFRSRLSIIAKLHGIISNIKASFRVSYILFAFAVMNTVIVGDDSHWGVGRGVRVRRDRRPHRIRLANGPVMGKEFLCIS